MEHENFYDLERFKGSASDSLLQLVGFFNKTIKCFKIHVSTDLDGWEEDRLENTFLLPEKTSGYSLVCVSLFDILGKLDTYAYNHVCISSIVWFTDGTWAERFAHEWNDNIAGWEIKSCPPIPKELLKESN